MGRPSPPARIANRTSLSGLFSALAPAGHAVSKIASTLSNAVLPGRCLICGDSAHAALCSLCNDVFWTAEADIRRCYQCGIRIPSDTSGTSASSAPFAIPASLSPSPSPTCSLATATRRKCGHCKIHPPSFDETLALADYRPPLDVLAIHFKFRGRSMIARDLAQRLAELMTARTALHVDALPRSLPNWAGQPDRADPASRPDRAHSTGQPDSAYLADQPDRASLADQPDRAYLLDLPDPLDMLVPAPLSSKRLAARGYNQAWEITRRVGAAMGIAAHPDLLMRHHSAAQSGLGLSARQRLISRAFFVPPEARAQLAGAHIGVIDDVMTTGATFEAIAQTLKQAGARRVTNLVVFRTA